MWGLSHVRIAGIEEVSFGWYLQRIAPGAIIGYVAGIAALVVQGGSAL